MATEIADYDANGYDYRHYRVGRDYERRAEERALRRLVPRLGRSRWLVDLGGGYGRNATHYRTGTDRYVIVDYSATNLRNAAGVVAGDLAAGRAFLVRADLNALPFVDAAFDTGFVVRVLHHLPDVATTLAEMGRVVGGSWLVDVPIKHHALGRLRALARGDWRAVCGADPMRTGTTAEPFWNFQLAAVRRLLTGAGFLVRVGASVNNLRRWDRRLAPWLATALRPAVDLAEVLAQRAGAGWWGPNQFVLAERPHPLVADVAGAPWPGSPAIAALMCCPRCRGRLSWTAGTAVCHRCRRRYERTDGFWDFTVDAPVMALSTAG